MISNAELEARIADSIEGSTTNTTTELEARIADSIANKGSFENSGPRGPLKTNHVIYPELSYAIIGAAIEVHRCMAPGQLEANYERALAIELHARGIPFERQVEFESYYRGEVIGSCVADIIVDDRIIVELKAVERVLPVHRAQLVGYLAATRLRLGLLINFNVTVLTHGVSRVIR